MYKFFVLWQVKCCSASLSMLCKYFIFSHLNICTRINVNTKIVLCFNISLHSQTFFVYISGISVIQLLHPTHFYDILYDNTIYSNIINYGKTKSKYK